MAGSDDSFEVRGWRVYLSYTSELREFPSGKSYVTAAERAISASGHAIVDLDFPDSDQPPAQLVTERVRTCNVYVAVLGTWYGSPVRDKPEVSYTELEFDSATEAGLDRLVFLLDTDTADVGIPLSALIDREFGSRQDAFRRRVRDSGLITQSFASPDALQLLVERSLRDLADTRRRRDSGLRREQVRPDGGAGAPTSEPAGAAMETVFGFSTDTPGLTAEVKASDDRLGIEDDVRTLCRLILARSTNPPLAIGLFGDWGTGKSFFMRRMQSRIQEMQQEAVTSLGRGGTSPYCDNVVQIPFNAWHYVDSNLWASLMTRIFEGLSPVTSVAARDYLFQQLDSTRNQLEQAQRDAVDASRQLGAIQTERDKLEQAQSAIRDQDGKPVRSLLDLLTTPGLPRDAQPPQPPESVKTLQELRQAAEDARSTARLIQRLLGWWPFRVLLVTAVLVVLVVNITSQASEVERWIADQMAAIEERQRRLTDDRQHAQQLADEAKRTLDSVRAGKLIRQYVEDRVTDKAYRDQLGIISLVREDLRQCQRL